MGRFRTTGPAENMQEEKARLKRNRKRKIAQAKRTAERIKRSAESTFFEDETLTADETTTPGTGDNIRIVQNKEAMVQEIAQPEAVNV